ncbi:hypothetical protein DdX_20213 [Ditylenchus destructor]|uniref:Uncharacterized protein n=1 Tax=Ditylenchus destructor TaxID=166010 RepID=A0AAD4ML68_9BILA|nr:hypothetical protein DdX_20213 [Ditylenchus destructor]
MNRIDGVFNCGKKEGGTVFLSHGDGALPSPDRTRDRAGDLGWRSRRGRCLASPPAHRRPALHRRPSGGLCDPCRSRGSNGRGFRGHRGSRRRSSCAGVQDPVVDLSPAQALAPGARGARVRWSGGINAIESRDGARQCFTLLHATFDARGVLQWPRDAQNFVACGPGHYAPGLVAQFTLVSLEGHVTGQQMLLDNPGFPLMEIEALYRHSDCVQGSEKSPECYAGYLRPQSP